MDFSGFGSLAGGGVAGGGIGAQMMALAQKMQGGGGAAAAQPAAAAPGPAVPADGSMQPTIGPGMPAAPAAPGYAPKVGLPKGGLLGIMQGGQPQGLAGMIQHLMGPGGTSLAGGMPQAGMLGPGSAGLPGSAYAGPPTPPVQLPTDINPMNQF